MEILTVNIYSCKNENNNTLWNIQETKIRIEYCERKNIGNSQDFIINKTVFG